MGMKENADMIKQFVNTDTGEAKDLTDILAAQCADLEKRVDILEEKLELATKFLKMQSSINNVLKFLVKKKYTEKELDEALNEFEEYEKHLKNDEKTEKK